MGKKPKLTPEEKKQLKAEKKLAKKLAAEELKRQIKRDHLAREITYTEMNKKKLEKQWREKLIKIKLPHIRIQFAYSMNNMERIFDLKNFAISFLLDELDDAEEQYMMNMRSHFEAIDELLLIFNERLDGLKDRYNQKLQEMLECAEIEITELKEKQKNEEEYLNTIQFGLDVESKYIEKFIKSGYLAKLDEETKRYEAELHAKKTQLEHQYNDMWNNFKSTMCSYISNNADIKKKYIELKTTDAAMQIMLKEHNLKIHYSFDFIKRLKEKQIVGKGWLDEKLDDLQKEKQYLLNAFYALKRRLKEDICLDDSKMLSITLRSNEVIKTLQTKRKLGEKILTIMTICRKFETQKEKVMPYPLAMSDVETPGKDKSRAHFSIVEERKELSSFWQRCGQADAVRHILHEEKTYLQKENSYLKNKVRQYCDDTACRCSELAKSKHQNDAICVIKASHSKKSIAL